MRSKMSFGRAHGRWNLTGTSRVLARKWLRWVPSRAKPGERVSVREVHILVVDDDADFREVLRHLLEDEGHMVSEAADGELALGVLLNVRPDLILFDLQMPVMNGWQLYAALQNDASLAAIPTAVLSGVGHKAPAGAAPVWKKPVNSDKLLSWLRSIGAVEA
jgi:CheY-like chemotaxis protein